MKRWIAYSFLMACTAAMADEFLAPDLPPRDVVRSWLLQDPVVREAQSGVSAAGHDAGMLRASPNEWTVNATGQRRTYGGNTPSREWNVGIERTFRLPGKRQLDGRLGDVEIALGESRYDQALRDAKHDLVDLWLDWRGAAETAVLVDDQVTLAKSNRDVVEKRLKAGDAAKLDLNVADTDLADIDRVRSEARTNETKARARLTARFSDVKADAGRLSDPAPFAEPVDFWKEQLLQRNPALRTAEAERERATLGATRARADRAPDPTIGVFSASEAFSNERIIGLSLSVPLSGSYRSQKMARALDAADQTEAALARMRQRVEAEAIELYSDAVGGHERWQLSTKTALRTSENVRLTQRAYSLGEVDLQTLLITQRQSLDTARIALQAQVDALRARYRLLIDSGRLWSDVGG
ncbi:MAG: TolC family protein [Dokdonella sp.]